MGEKMRRIRCKGEDEKGRHEDGSSIDLRGDVVINRVEGVEDKVAPIDPSLTSISKGGGLSEDSGKVSTTGLTRSCGTPTRSFSCTGLAYWSSASFYHHWYWFLLRAALGPPSSYSWPPVVWDASWWWTMTT